VHLLALLLHAAVGVADPAQRFSPVPEPAGLADPCRDRGPAGRWIKMSEAGAPASIHDQSWLDSAAVWDGGRMVVALRRSGKWSGSAFDPCRNAWTPVAETASLAHEEPWPSDGHDRPFQASHATGSNDGFEKVSVWDAGRKAWVTIEAKPPVAPRAHYAVALAGHRLLVWGGWAYNLGALGDGAVLDLGHKTWKKMTVVGAPSPRLEPTAVAWSGSRLVVWGGRVVTPKPGSPTTLGDGAQYDPAADRWTPISSVNAPSPRTDATVAWTGRKLVVVGGASTLGGQALRDGGVYDPATDRWTPLPPPPGEVVLPKANVGPLTRILVAPDGRVVLLPNHLRQVLVLDADRARWSAIDAQELGNRGEYRAFLVGRRLVIWGGVTVTAEHLCGPHLEGQPQCDPWAERAPNNDGYMMLLP
jgi:hypothetical protein